MKIPAYETFETKWPVITVQLDRETRGGGERGMHFAGQLEFCGGPKDIPGQLRRVHVMSSASKGEIRSYELDESNGLRLVGPCYTGSWTEMDVEVAHVLKATVHSYTIAAGGPVS